MEKNKLNIIPTLFSKSLNEFQDKFERVKNLSKLLHIDIMDGKFVPSKSVDLKKLEFIKNEKNKFEVHLMCKDPFSYFNLCEKLGIYRVYIHFEVFQSSIELMKFVKEHKRKFEIGIAISPETSFDEVVPIIKNIKNIMFMSVKPGAEGQVFIMETFQKVRRSHDLNPKINIQVDGGIKVEEIRRLVHNGAKTFCVGSYLSSADFPKENYNLLKTSMDLGEMEEKHIIHISEPYSKITNEIYLGPNRCCRTFKFDQKLLDIGIKAEINLEEFGMEGTFGVDFYLWIPTKDHMAPKMEQMITAVKAIDELVKRKIKMYIHCELGHTRSPTLIAAYFIYKGMKINEAIEYIKKRRPSIAITNYQKEALKKFEIEIKK